MKRILAYFLHEDEQALIASVLQNAKATEGYLIGDVSEADLGRLREGGISYKILRKEEAYLNFTGDAGAPKTFNLKEHWEHRSQIESIINFNKRISDSSGDENFVVDFPAYFTMTLDGPILPEYKERIDDLSVRIYQYLGNDTYVVLCNEGDPQKLAELPFVEKVSYYGVAKTPFELGPKLSDSLREEKVFVGTSQYDVILHRKEDLESFLSWLRQNQYEIVGNSDLKVRILIKGMKKKDFVDLSANKYVQRIERFIPPQLFNELSREILQIDKQDAGTGLRTLQLEFEGEGQIIGVADTGIDDSHPDLNGQFTGIVSLGRAADTSDPNGHGTHVTGSIVGNGTASGGQVKGVAPKAKVFFQSLLLTNGKLNIPIDLKDLFRQAYDQGARIHNNSWGAATKSRYTANSTEVDDFVYNHPDMLLVFSAGNDGRGNKFFNVPQGYTDLLSLGSPATAKNALTVGASRSQRSKGGYSRLTYGKVWEHFPHDPTFSANISGDMESMAAFSSRGPVDDNWRIKPDVVAPGTDIASTLSKDADLSTFCGIHPLFDDYALLCGTSMSAPLVAGCAALVREYYQKQRAHQPSAALMKATLINSCRLLKGQDGNLNNSNIPHFHQGFGLIDMLQCIPNQANDFNLLFIDTYLEQQYQIRQNGQKVKFGLSLTQKASLKICLVYTDFPGRGIQNNILLFADCRDQKKKWIGNEFMPKFLNVMEPTYEVSVDLNNNVQAIVIPEAEPGEYTVQAIAHNVWKVPQDFAIVITTGDKSASIQSLNL